MFSGGEVIESSVYLVLVVQICKLIYMGNTPHHTRKKLAHPGFDPCSNLNFGVKFEWAALHAHAHYKHTGEVRTDLLCRTQRQE